MRNVGPDQETSNRRSFGYWQYIRPPAARLANGSSIAFRLPWSLSEGLVRAKQLPPRSRLTALDYRARCPSDRPSTSSIRTIGGKRNPLRPTQLGSREGTPGPHEGPGPKLPADRPAALPDRQGHGRQPLSCLLHPSCAADRLRARAAWPPSEHCARPAAAFLLGWAECHSLSLTCSGAPPSAPKSCVRRRG
jgi:hypothetical protein